MIKLLKWIFIKAWPIVALIPIIAIHFLLLNMECFSKEYLCYNNSEINKLVSLLMQLSGGLLILISIDSNIGLFKNSSLLGGIFDWYEQRPWRKHESKNASASVSLTLPPLEFSARGHIVPTTLEAKVELLETKISWLNEDINKNKKEIDGRLQALKSTISQDHSAHTEKINDLQKSLIQSSSGGLKLHVFGGILVFYSPVFELFYLITK